MLLSEEQMSDDKGAALMLPAPPCPRPGSFSPTKPTTPIGCAQPSLNPASPPAFPRNPIERSRSPTTPSSRNSATNRKRVRTPQRLAAHPHPLRPLHSHRLLGNLYRPAAVAFWL